MYCTLVQNHHNLYVVIVTEQFQVVAKTCCLWSCRHFGSITLCDCLKPATPSTML